MKRSLDITHDDFRAPIELGLDAVKFDVPVAMSAESMKSIGNIAGAENVATDDYSRLRSSCGKMIYDLASWAIRLMAQTPP
ncbi:MAG: hypothetical protein VB144_15335 [Clostridia bacterium]|nr:hypothetical protein [Clostridia bacterium]